LKHRRHLKTYSLGSPFLSSVFMQPQIFSDYDKNSCMCAFDHGVPSPDSVQDLVA
jgi:hypothetical protein